MRFIAKILEKFFLLRYQAKFIFEDYYHNQYYELNKKDAFGRNGRYVKYIAGRDASFTPPICNGWLRFDCTNKELQNSNELLSEIDYAKPHRPECTGTNHAYSPVNFNKKNHSKDIYQNWIKEE